MFNFENVLSPKIEKTEEAPLLQKIREHSDVVAPILTTLALTAFVNSSLELGKDSYTETIRYKQELEMGSKAKKMEKKSVYKKEYEISLGKSVKNDTVGGDDTYYHAGWEYESDETKA